MTAHRSIVGLTVLCALVFSAFAAANASAAGTTVFTCVKGTPAEFGNADCTSTAGTKEWRHVEVAAGTSTPIQTKAVNTQVLTGTLGGFEVKLTATGVEVNTETGNVNTVKNNAGPPMTFSGETRLTYTGVTVDKPAGCKVAGGMITTEQLKFNSINKGTGKKETGVNFEPTAGATATFAKVPLSECSAPSLDGTYPVKGSVVGYTTSPGAILAFSNESESLTLGGNPAVLTGETTQSNRTSGTALSATTTAS